MGPEFHGLDCRINRAVGGNDNDSRFQERFPYTHGRPRDRHFRGILKSVITKSYRPAL